MVIKTPRHLTVLIILVMSLATFCILYFSYNNGLLEFCTVILLWLGALFLVVSDCKTLIMDKDGITVKFLLFKKKYSWDCFQTKRIQTFAKSLSGEPSVRGAFFSKKKNQKAVFPPSNFDTLFPLSFRYVYFKSKSKFSDTLYFEVDEKVFREKMKEWEIEFIEDSE